MLMVCRKVSIMLSGFIVTSAVIATIGGQPEGFWVLENADQEMPFAGLKLNSSDHFELLVYDSSCRLYTVEGNIKQNSPKSWELKNSADYSNTFLMTRAGEKLKLVDTEEQQLLFLETTHSQLKKSLKQHCSFLHQNNL